MKKQILGAIVLLVVLSMTGCASDTPTPTAQPTTQAPTQSPTGAPTEAPTPEPATTEPMATTLGPQNTTSNGTEESGALKDGTYQAEMSQALAEADQGWQGYLILTVSGGDVTQAEFDYTKDGKKKSETTAEEYPMNPAPSEWIPTYQEAVLKAGASGAQIDTVSGATRSAADINTLYKAALEAAREGNTQTVVVEESEQEQKSAS